MPASCCGRRRAADANGLGAGGDGRFSGCVCVLAGVCSGRNSLFWPWQVGWLLWVSDDGLGCSWGARDPPARCVLCAPPAPASRQVLTRFAWLRPVPRLSARSVRPASGLPLPRAPMVAADPLCSLSACRLRAWQFRPRSASGVRPARALDVAVGGELAVLHRVCLPAAGRWVKTRLLGCCATGRSAVVVGQRAGVLLRVFV